jgi:hypothetical protein
MSMLPKQYRDMLTLYSIRLVAQLSDHCSRQDTHTRQEAHFLVSLGFKLER